MADPRNELADIIAPAAPAAAAAGDGSLWLWAVAGLGLVAGVALAAWLWQRRRPLRELHAIVVAAARRQAEPAALAASLDAWARQRFGLTRVDPAACPPDLDPAAWFGWAKRLEQLRFARQAPDGFAVLADLCQSARRWGRRA
jgi:hypothetical protein